jgi:hypothetical protein
MKRNRSRLVGAGMGVVIAFSVALGLASSPAGAAETGPGSFEVQRIGVMPFFKGSYGSDITSSITCPVCDLTFDPENLTPDCDRILTGFAQDLLQIRYGDKLVPMLDVMRAYRQMPKDEFKDTPLGLTQRLGKALSANAMILGTVWRYRERRGGARAVESPASVAFAVHLVEVETGNILWSKAFAETQQSLSENILKAPAFFARGARWLIADELARFGMEEIFKAFPY